MERRKIIRSLASVFGSVLALAGVGVLLLAASGSVVQGQAGAYIFGAGLLAAAIPLLLASFFARFAEVVAAVVFAGFAAAMLWLAFGPSGTTPPIAFQVAAVLFGLLFLLRVGLALRKRPNVGT